MFGRQDEGAVNASAEAYAASMILVVVGLPPRPALIRERAILIDALAADRVIRALPALIRSAPAISVAGVVVPAVPVRTARPAIGLGVTPALLIRAIAVAALVGRLLLRVAREQLVAQQPPDLA